MSKRIEVNESARAALKRGIDTLANLAKITLGPKGRNVIIQDQFGPYATKDGVSIVRRIELDDEIENAGAQIVKDVAIKTVDEFGDGTTTATIFAQAIFSEGMKNIAAGANPMELKRGIDEAVKSVVSFIENLAIPINDNWELIEQVAVVSANGDVSTGKLIADTLRKVGSDGIITLDESKTSETHVNVVEGLQIDSGWISPYFANIRDTMKCVFENPYILLVENEVTAFKDLLPILKRITDIQKPLVIISFDVNGESLGTLVTNRVKGGMPICCVRVPGNPEQKQELLEDIAIVTGGTVMSERTGRKLGDGTVIKDLGICKKIIISKDTCLIVGGSGDTKEIEDRGNALKLEAETAKNEKWKYFLKERVAKLTAGIGVIYVGGQTEIEMKELRDRCDDALGATRAALKGGICPGGGVAYIRAQSALESLSLSTLDANTGVDIIRKALLYPLRQILENAGKGESGILAQVIDSKGNDGYNARTDEFEDLIKGGVIDPSAVLVACLQNAASVSSMLLTTEGILVEKKKDEKKN